MPISDVQKILFTHDRWATRQILEACSRLTDEQFHQSFDIGPGSLHNATTHLLGSMKFWTQIMSDRTPETRIDQDGRKRSATELLSLLEPISREFEAEAHRQPLDEMVTRTSADGKTYRITRAAAIAQVLTHGMHHRAQCLNMLRRLGIKPLPPSSVVEWARMGEPAS